METRFQTLRRKLSFARKWNSPAKEWAAFLLTGAILVAMGLAIGHALQNRAIEDAIQAALRATESDQSVGQGTALSRRVAYGVLQAIAPSAGIQPRSIRVSICSLDGRAFATSPLLTSPADACSRAGASGVFPLAHFDPPLELVVAYRLGWSEPWGLFLATLLLGMLGAVVAMWSLRRRDAEFATLAAQVAHDIRSPIAALGVVLPAASVSLPEEDRRIFALAVERINEVASDLLKTRRERRPRPARAKPLGNASGCAEAQTRVDRPVALSTRSRRVSEMSKESLAFLAERVVVEKQAAFRARPGLRIEFTAPPGEREARASVVPHEFKRVLSNLINNAAEAIESSGTVSIEVSESESTSEVTIVDDGSGMPPEVISALSRGEAATSGKTEGNGLGLAHALQAVGGWGGRLEITAAEKPRRGTIVRIVLPSA